jgi:hypothetical protein
MSGQRSNQEHPARRRARVSKRVRCTRRDKYASSRPATNGALAAVQIEFSLKNVENLFDLGVVVVGAGLESRRNRKLEQAVVGKYVHVAAQAIRPVRFQSAMRSKADIART